MEVIEDIIQKSISFIISPYPNELFFNIKIGATIIILILIGFIVFILLTTQWLRFRFLYNFVEFFTYKPFGVKKIERDWKKIKLRMEKGIESEYKLAIIEVDNMLNDILKEMKYQGESLGEQLEKVASFVFSNIEELKEAHQIRNNIVHDPNYRLSLEKAKSVLDIFEEAFKALDVF